MFLTFAALVLCSLAGLTIYLLLVIRGRTISERNMADALDHVAAAIYMKDVQRRYVYANSTTIRLLRTSRRALLGACDDDLLPAAEAQRIRTSDEWVLESGEDIRDELVVGDDPVTQTVFLELKHPLRNKLGNIVGLVGISTDVTELYRLRRDLEHAARTDELTSVYNRRALFEYAEQDVANARRHGRPVSMLIIDVDFFKRINDNYGHPVGDRVLKDVAAQARQAVREIDRLGRIGGEEFAVILPEADLAQTVDIAERVRSAMRPLPLQGGISITPCVSVGVASLLPEDRGVEDLYQRADQALYRAKQAGRNRVVAQESHAGAGQ